MTCAKRIVRCTIITRDGRAFSGENACDEPQKRCPRRKGEGYAKCESVCKQPGHAEIVALAQIELRGAVGATAIITGIDHMCKECARALSKAGVDEIILRRSL